MKYSKIIIAFFIVLLIAACNKKDEYVYPPVITELLTTQSSSEGTLLNLITDKGEIFRVQNGSKVKGMVPDSLYRMLCIYELLDIANSKEKEASLYSIQQVFSIDPVEASHFKLMITDPVIRQSVWMSGGYLNLFLFIKAKDTHIHRFHFAETYDGVIEVDGKRKLYLTLYHDKGTDIEAYSQRTCFSIPLRKYKNILQKGDSVLFTLNEYNKGMVTYRFAF
ncbi:MAG: NigD-like C-terminal domain-containing protein [Bacteroides sp.]